MALVIIILLVLLLVALTPLFTTFLWNWLMPYIFHLPVIDYWQALGLEVLLWLLFPRGVGGASKRNT